MGRIGPGVFKIRIQLVFLAPVFDARRFRGHEFVEIDRAKLVPDAPLAAVVRNAALGGDAGAREYDRVVDGGDFFCKPVDVVFHLFHLRPASLTISWRET